MEENPGEIWLLGGGNLGFALASRWIGHGLIDQQKITIFEAQADRRRSLQNQFPRVNVVQTLSEEGPRRYPAAGAIILCVKPQEASSALAGLRPHLDPDALVISPMAGVSLARLQEVLGHHPQLVRCMPNLGALHGLSMTVFLCSRDISARHRGVAHVLLQALGETLEVFSDELVDAATAVSGSGPAYMFYLVEKLEEAAAQLGFSGEEAQLLVRQTLRAASALLVSPQQSAKDLRSQVTSKGGTTEAAFRLFDAKDLGGALNEGIKRAFERARALAK